MKIIYFENGKGIAKYRFDINVPSGYIEHLREYGVYSYGNFKAVFVWNVIIPQ